jgi:hypothetical protein
MTEQAELAFAKTFLNTLSTQPVTFANDYRQPLENSLKRITVFPVCPCLSFVQTPRSNRTRSLCLNLLNEMGPTALLPALVCPYHFQSRWLLIVMIMTISFDPFVYRI